MLEAELVGAGVRFAVNEEALLNVVVVPALKPGQLTVHPPKLLRPFGHARILGPQALQAPFPCNLAGDHLVGRQRHDVGEAFGLLGVQQADHLAGARRDNLCQRLRRARFGHHVDLASAVLVAVKREARLLGVDAVGHLQDQNVAVRLPKPVEQLRLQVHHVHQRLVLGQHWVRLCHHGLQGVARRAVPDLHVCHHDQFPGRTNFSRQRHPRRVAGTRRHSEPHPHEEGPGCGPLKSCWGRHG